MKTISHSWIPARSHIPQNIATKNMINHYLQKVSSMLWNSENSRISKTMKTISHSWVLAYSHMQKPSASRKHKKPLATTDFQHALGIGKITNLGKSLKTVSHRRVSACSHIHETSASLKNIKNH